MVFPMKCGVFSCNFSHQPIQWHQKRKEIPWTKPQMGHFFPKWRTAFLQVRFFLSAISGWSHVYPFLDWAWNHMNFQIRTCKTRKINLKRWPYWLVRNDGLSRYFEKINNQKKDIVYSFAFTTLLRFRFYPHQSSSDHHVESPLKHPWLILLSIHFFLGLHLQLQIFLVLFLSLCFFS